MSGSQRRRKTPKRTAARTRQVTAAGGASFWDAKALLDEPVARIPPPSDPTVMVRSLGPAPLPGRETIAEHYFASVYDKAAALATALAAAAELLDTDTRD